MKRLGGLLLKIAISAVLLYVVWRRLPEKGVAEALSGARVDLVLAALVLLLSRAAVWGERFRNLLVHRGIPVTRRTAVRSYLVSFFFSLGLPTVIGGDVARGYWVYREAKKGPEVAGVVLFERAAGLAAVAAVVLPLLGATALLVERPAARLSLAALAAGILVLFALAALVDASRFARGRVARVLSAIHESGRSARALVPTLLWSLAGQAVTILAGILAARAVGVDAPLPLLAAVFPVVWLATMVPVSFGGLGVREAALVVLLSPHGVPEDRCALLGLTLSALFLAQGAVGGVAFLLSRGSTRKDRSPDRSPGRAPGASGSPPRG